MKKIFFLFLILLAIQHNVSAQSVFELSPNQSMSITGKGPGQDAAINPFSNEGSKAVIKNLSKNSFEIRIQKNGEVLETILVKAKEVKEVELLMGYELYLDSRLKAKADVTFKKLEKETHPKVE